MPATQTPTVLQREGDCHQRRSLRASMRWEQNLPGELAERMWRNPYGLLATGQPLHTKLNCSVVQLNTPAGHFVLKHQDSGRFWRRVKKSLSKGEARQSWAWSNRLAALGIPTPQPRALREARVGPFRTSSLLLSDFVPGDTLYRRLRHDPPSEPELIALAAQLADVWARLDAASLCHNDFKPENLLIDEQHQLWLIDFDRMRHEPEPAPRRQRQARDLADFFHPRSWRENTAAVDIFRQALLRQPCVQELLHHSPTTEELLTQPLEKTDWQAGRLSVIIPCHNAAQTIAACIASVRDIADEILLADAGSHDATLHRARQAGGCRIVQHPNADPLAFEAWAQRQVKHPWTLRLLPQEQLNPELARQIQDLLASNPAENGFEIARAIRFRGRRLEFGEFPRTAELRLYRSDQARHEQIAGQVQVRLTGGATGRLKSCLLVDWSPAPHAPAASSLQTAWNFLRSYLWRGGWLDGRLGWQAARLAARLRPLPTAEPTKGRVEREAA